VFGPTFETVKIKMSAITYKDSEISGENGEYEKHENRNNEY
jgi:hypothetical protein